jgi:hypothetical protein
MASLQMPKALISTTASLRSYKTRRIKARRSQKIKAPAVRPCLRYVLSAVRKLDAAVEIG